MDSQSFNDLDVKKLEEFGRFLIEKAKFTDLTIQEAVALNRHLSFYNTITEKVKANILEIQKVSQPDPKKGKR